MNDPQIFLSYAHENKDVVVGLHDILTNKYKFNVWFDTRHIKLGEQIHEKVYSGIVNSKLIICCFSQAYLDSEMCIREFIAAKHKKKTCFAFMLEKVDIEDNPKTALYTIGMLRCDIYKNKEEKPPIDLFDGARFDDFIENIESILDIKREKKKDDFLYDAYISYDFEFARRSNRLTEHFINHGFNIYRELLRKGIVDKDFEITKNAIDGSRIFICCGTKSYSKNDICLREIDYADARRKPKLVLMFEDRTKKELKRLGDLMDDACRVDMFKDKNSEYEEGAGKMFHEAVAVLQSLLEREKAVTSKPKEKTNDLWITFNNEIRALVEDFAKRLSKEKGIQASYDSNGDQGVPNYDAVERSKTVVAIVTLKFETSFSCLEETSCANRNSIPITYVIDKNLKVKETPQCRQLIEETPSKNIHVDLDVLKEPITENPVVTSIESNVQEVEEKILNDENIFEAAKNNDISKIASLIKKGVNVNDKDKDGKTALMWASGNGHLDVIKYLIEHGANVNAEGNFGWTALMDASLGGHLDVIKYFIEEHGVNLNDKDNDGETALMLASLGGHLDVIKYLIEHGANVNDKDKNGRTALMFASLGGHLDVIKYLIEHGANVNDKEKDGWTALMKAFQRGHLDVIKYFIEKHGANVNDKTKYGQTALMSASERGHLDVIKYFIEKHGANVNDKDKDGKTALMKASGNGHLDVIKYLIEHGANVNAEGNFGWTALMDASLGGHLDVIKYFIEEHGVNLNDKDNDGETALMLASLGGHLDVIKYLIEHGANVNDKDKNGRTALMFASLGGHLDVIKYLIEHGANVNDKEKDGWTALMKAFQRGHLDVIKYFIEKHGANVNDKTKYGQTALMSASERGHLDVIKYFIEKHGANVNDKDKDGKTALMKASENGHLDVIKYFIEEHGVNVNDKDKDGETVLMKASENGHLDVIKYFIEEHRANVNDKDKDGKTALMEASENGQLDVIKYLFEHGANVNDKDKDGRTALIKASNTEVKNFLLEHSTKKKK